MKISEPEFRGQILGILDFGKKWGLSRVKGQFWGMCKMEVCPEMLGDAKTHEMNGDMIGVDMI